MEFVDTTSKNLLDPGASFANAFQGGQQMAMQRNQLAQQKQLAMSELGEKAKEFSLTNQLQQQELEVNKQRTMADIGMMGAQQKLTGIQAQNAQFQADQLPKIAANNAYYQQVQKDPSTWDIQNGVQNASALLANAPHPDAVNPAETDSILTSIKTRNFSTAAGLAFQNQQANTLGVISKATDSGININDPKYLKNPNAPASPDNINASALAQDSVAIDTQRHLALQQSINDMQEKARVGEIDAQGAWRLKSSLTAAGRYKTVAALTNAERNLQRLSNSGITSGPEYVKSQRQYQDALNNASDDSDSIPASAIPGADAQVPGAGSMQNPAGTPQTNPTLNKWNNSINPSSGQ